MREEEITEDVIRRCQEYGLECLTLREGQTRVQIGKSGHPYMFQPRRDALSPQTGNTSSLHRVDAEPHIRHLLRQGNFRPYDPKVPPPADNPIWDLGNYHIEKCVIGQTEGYRIVRKSPRAFMGANLDWRPATTAEEMKLALQSIVPFDRETKAFYALMDYVKVHHPELELKPNIFVPSPDQLSAKEEELATLRAENKRIMEENERIKSLIPSADDIAQLIDAAVNKRMSEKSPVPDEPDFKALAGKKK